MWLKGGSASSDTGSENHSKENFPKENTSTGNDKGFLSKELVIEGEISGNQDMVIEGTLQGQIKLLNNCALIDKPGRVRGDIYARVIEVSGQVQGNLKAIERVVVKPSGVIEGDIVSPQVRLEEGCRFKGAVQMREPDHSSTTDDKPRVTGSPGEIKLKKASGG